MPQIKSQAINRKNLLNQIRDNIVDFFKGDQSLGIAFWGFGIFGGYLLKMIIFGILFMITDNYPVISQLIGRRGMEILFITPILIIWFVLSVGIWRCGRKANPLWKRVSRLTYIGLIGIFPVFIFVNAVFDLKL